jgi:hypothetical protein
MFLREKMTLALRAWWVQQVVGSHAYVTLPIHAGDARHIMKV